MLILKKKSSRIIPSNRHFPNISKNKKNILYRHRKKAWRILQQAAGIQAVKHIYIYNA